MKRALLILLLGSGTATWLAGAGERKWSLPTETAELKPGPGVEVASAQCRLCHSTDYIATQPTLNRATWTAEVLKMRDKFGAPIATNDVEILVNYLTKTYGMEKGK